MAPPQYAFSFHLNPGVAPLAWCARLVRGSRTVEVEHGDWVETRSDRFVEGAWNGAFADSELATAEIVLGSGGALRGDAVAFTPTTHTMERLYSLRLDGSLFVSNSLPYLLAATDSCLDVHDWTYERDLMSFLRGYKRAVQQLRLVEGRTLSLHYHRTLLVDAGLRTATLEPPTPPNFRSYPEYIGYLHAAIAMLHANATAAERRVQYSPLATISSGYDSPACAILARHIGGRRAVTFAAARAEFSAGTVDTDDSGQQIGERLGFEVEKFSRLSYLDAGDFPEAHFLATGNGGDDVILSVLRGRIEGTMLFTGVLGDTLWNATPTQDPAVSEEYRFRYPAGGSTQEFRLATGFVHLPVPLLTFVRHADIARISASDEMRPWRVGGDYDRPIPRRLAEEAGIARDAFAKEKRAVTQPFWLQPASRATMSARSLADFQQFRARVAAEYPFGTRTLTALHAVRRPLYKLRRGYRRLVVRDPFYSSAYMLAATAEPLRFHWAVEKVLETYRCTGFRSAEHSRARRPSDSRWTRHTGTVSH